MLPLLLLRRQSSKCLLCIFASRKGLGLFDSLISAHFCVCGLDKGGMDVKEKGRQRLRQDLSLPPAWSSPPATHSLTHWVTGGLLPEDLIGPKRENLSSEGVWLCFAEV